jgi:uncharacterized protein YutE (UPF0331/DUF86 family)
MGDDVLLNKAEIIERCLKRVREINPQGSGGFKEDMLRQDATILNIERACQAAIDAGMRITRMKGLGVPKESREVFEFLATAGIINENLAGQLKKLVGFRNIAIHNYQKMNLDIVIRLMESDFQDLRAFVPILVRL